METTYKLRGVEFTVNAFGCLLGCSDWETLYPKDARPGEEHRGTNADLFQQGYGGKYWATEKFAELTVL